MVRDKKIVAVLLVILKAESFYYYTIFDHMTNSYWHIKQNNKKSFSHVQTFFLQPWVYKKQEFLQIPQQK